MAWRSFLFKIFFEGYNGMLIRWPQVVAMGNALVFPLMTSTVMLRSENMKIVSSGIPFPYHAIVLNKWASTFYGHI